MRKTGLSRVLARWRLPLILVAAVLIGGGAGVATGSWQSVCRDCPSVAQIYAWEPKSSTRLLSHDGQLIAELFHIACAVDKNRIVRCGGRSGERCWLQHAAS